MQQLSPAQGASASAQAVEPVLTPELCVIGAGAGGLAVAAAVAAFGRSVVLIEKSRMGGDGLNTGSVPSKALVAAASRAHAMRSSAPFGIAPVDPEIDPRAVNAHVRAVIAAIAPNAAAERFTGLGVKVVQGAARFLDRATVAVGEQRVKASRYVIATGASPLVPPIPGLDQVAYFTNETIFENQATLDHLIVVGAGPLGLELAQAHLRLGARVTVLESKRALGREDPELVGPLLEVLRAEGLVIHEGANVVAVEGRTGELRVRVEHASGTAVIAGSHILVATGRKPNLADLDLAAAGIRHDAAGIKVNAGLRTSNSRVYAIGDCAGGPQATHLADYHAGLVISRVLFRLPARADNRILPRVTYCEPELASVGLSEDEARARHGTIRILRASFHDNDRAQAECTTEGGVKVVCDRRGRILGAGIVGARAGELIQVWALAVSQRLHVRAMTQWIAPYPTLGEINKRVAYRYYATAPSNPLVRKLVGWLAKLG